MNRPVLASLTILCLLSVPSVTGLIHLTKADGGTICIQADGSIVPSTAPISTVDNTTYTFTGNVSESTGMLAIVVERDSIVLDGQGYTVQGTGNGTGTGITLSERNNVTIKNMTITAFGIGIYVCNSSSHNSFSGNNVTANSYGIVIVYSSDNSISGNNVTANKWDGIAVGNSSSYNSFSGNNVTANNEDGIFIDFSSNNSMNGNILTNNGEGIQFYYSCSNNSVSRNNVANNGNGTTFYYSSSNNTIYRNNFMNNTRQVYSSDSTNVWDNGIEGNYWSDYNGADNNQDGIGDTSYIIDANNTDHYPLMGRFKSFNVSTWSRPNDGFEEVDVISNSAISNLVLYGWLTTPNQYLQTGQIFLSLTPVQGQNMTAGFCRITVPNNILNTSDYTVLINMTPVSVNRLATSNSTQTTLYFTFNTSPDEIIIVTEFPSFLILPLFFITTLLGVIFYRKKHARISGSP